MLRATSRIVIILGLLLMGVSAPLLPVQVALGNDTVVSAPCTESQFDEALAAAHANGGGRITFDCGEPATLTFSSQKVIAAPQGIVIDGAHTVTLSGGDATRLFAVEPGAGLEITRLTVSGGSSAASGGAIFNNGELTISDSTFDGNRAHNNGGAILNNGGSVVITRSTLSNNVANNGGGAIRNNSSSALTIVYSTLSGNSAKNRGGTILNAGGVVGIAATTVANSRSGYGSAAIDNGNLILTMRQTLVHNQPAGSDCIGEIWSAGFNLDSDGTCNLTQRSDTPNANVELGPLEDKGDRR